MSTKHTAIEAGHGPWSWDVRPRAMHRGIAAVAPEYSTSLHIPVQWGEQDAFGHLNNVVYMRYFESARMQYLIDFSQYLPEGLRHTFAHPSAEHPGPIVASVTTRYRAQVHYPDALSYFLRVAPEDMPELRAIAALEDGVDVVAWAKDQGKKRAKDRMTVEYVAFSHRHGTIAADGTCLIVAFNYGDNTKAPISPTVARAIVRWEDEGRRRHVDEYAKATYADASPAPAADTADSLSSSNTSLSTVDSAAAANPPTAAAADPMVVDTPDEDKSRRPARKRAKKADGEAAPAPAAPATRRSARAPKPSAKAVTAEGDDLSDEEEEEAAPRTTRTRSGRVSGAAATPAATPKKAAAPAKGKAKAAAPAKPKAAPAAAAAGKKKPARQTKAQRLAEARATQQQLVEHAVAEPAYFAYDRASPLAQLPSLAPLLTKDHWAMLTDADRAELLAMLPDADLFADGSALRHDFFNATNLTTQAERYLEYLECGLLAHVLADSVLAGDAAKEAVAAAESKPGAPKRPRNPAKPIPDLRLMQVKQGELDPAALDGPDAPWLRALFCDDDEGGDDAEAWKDENFESFWGELAERQRRKNKHAAGASAQVTVADLLKAGAIRAGDKVRYFKKFVRPFAFQIDALVELKTVANTKFTGVLLEESVDFEDAAHARPAATPAAPTDLAFRSFNDLEGVLYERALGTREARPNGNVWRNTKRVRGGTKDVTLFQLRREFIAAGENRPTGKRNVGVVE
ncbi:hypothetical protein H9P43_000267 [Blastocladiella emersonii ATCC 22665]|nr:hypothetical protein H9P43_000267 [Blastocladiella emersonii ATCC 22665]